MAYGIIIALSIIIGFSWAYALVSTSLEEVEEQKEKDDES